MPLRSSTLNNMPCSAETPRCCIVQKKTGSGASVEGCLWISSRITLRDPPLVMYNACGYFKVANSIGHCYENPAWVVEHHWITGTRLRKGQTRDHYRRVHRGMATTNGGSSDRLTKYDIIRTLRYSGERAVITKVPNLLAERFISIICVTAIS
jgi:hypothetical protein